MENQELIQKWKKYFAHNKIFLKELSKLEEIKVNETNFLQPIKNIGFRIISSFGVGLNKLNELVLRSILYHFINEEIQDKDDLVLIASDGTETTKKLIESLSYLKLKKGKLITLENFEGIDIKIINEIFKKIDIKIGLYAQQSIYEKNLFEVFLLNKNGEYFDEKYIKNLINKTHNNDYFATPLSNYSEIFFVDTLQIIKIFVNKIIPLYTKKIDSSKTKIAISNHNKEVTNVVSKLLGNLDYAYIVNEKPSSKNIFNFKMINDWKMQKIFNDEIRFAKKRKANLLISFNENGTQLFLFTKIKNKFVYLNNKLISIILLHNFFNDLIINNCKISNFYISSDEQPLNSLLNIITKYNLTFKLHPTITLDEQKYLLYYWNSYNQFSFGEKRNSLFSIYHILIKLIEIINFYNLQFGDLDSHLSDLNLMYDSFFESKVFYKISKNDLVEKINNLIQTKNSKEYVKMNIKKIEIINSNKTDNNDEEQHLFTITLNNESIFLIKFNKIIDKAIFVYRISNYKKNNAIINNYQKFNILLFIKKIMQ